MLDRQYVYFPEPWEERNWSGIFDLPLEEVWFRSEDDVELFGWYVQSPVRRPNGSDTQAVFLWCHGNAGNISHRLENLSELYRRGISTFLFDYRGYGRSHGQPSEEGLYRDALAAWEVLTKLKKILPARVIAFGRSLGAAVAAEVTRRKQVAGLILESPFPSIETMARRMFGGLPAHWVLKARFDLAKRLKQVQVPVLVLHGDRDTVIPFELGEAVYQAANEPKTFYRIEGADHNDTTLVGGEPYFQELLRFVQLVIP